MSVMNVALAQSGLGDYIFGLDPQLIFDSLITILAMFFLFLFLSYLLFNPARNLMQKRQETIRQEMETAAKEKADAIQFKNVDKESEEILSETRKKALKKETAIVGEAKEEANRILERANREVELEKNKVKDEVKQEMISVATAMAGKVIEVSLDEGKQSQLIEDTLKEMGDETWLS